MKHESTIEQIIRDIVAQEVADAMTPLRAEIDKLKQEVQTPVTRAGKLLIRTDAMAYIRSNGRTCGQTTMSKWIGAGLITPDNDTSNGERDWFARTELDRFLSIPSGTVKMEVAMWEAKQKRERQ